MVATGSEYSLGVGPPSVASGLPVAKAIFTVFSIRIVNSESFIEDNVTDRASVASEISISSAARDANESIIIDIGADGRRSYSLSRCFTL